MPADEHLHQAADTAYGIFYSYCNPVFTGKAKAWKGDPEHNPMLRPLKAALKRLADLEEEDANATSG